jgi:hypothetical protein
VNKRILISVIFGTLALSIASLPSWSADNLTGTWAGQISDPVSGAHQIVLRLKVSGDKISGTLEGGPPNGEPQPIQDAQLEGDQLSFKVNAKGPDGELVALTYQGKVSGNHIAGTHKGPHLGPTGEVPWEVTKK